MHQQPATLIVVAILIFVLCSFTYSIYRITRQDSHPTIDITIRRHGLEPTRAHTGDAGADLRAAHWAKIPVGGRELISTGLEIAIPYGRVGILASRSGHGLIGVSLANSNGWLDPGFRGEVKAIIENRGDKPFEVNPHDRIAQLIVVPIDLPTFRVVDKLPPAERGNRGFGSTGVK